MCTLAILTLFQFEHDRFVTLCCIMVAALFILLGIFLILNRYIVLLDLVLSF
jgi:hypothetical protein